MAKTLVNRSLLGIAEASCRVSVVDREAWAYDDAIVDAYGSAVIYVVGSPTVRLHDDAVVVIVWGEPTIYRTQSRNPIYVHTDHPNAVYYAKGVNTRVIPGVDFARDAGWYWKGESHAHITKSLDVVDSTGAHRANTDRNTKRPGGRRTRTNCTDASRRKTTASKRAA